MTNNSTNTTIKRNRDVIIGFNKELKGKKYINRTTKYIVIK